jgi:hypothetical protein
MYIKVNKRLNKKFKREKQETEVISQTFQFSVIEGYRENGKVKHRTLMYLGSIRQSFLWSPALTEHFLKDCKNKLESLPDADKLQLMTSIETCVLRARGYLTTSCIN